MEKALITIFIILLAISLFQPSISIGEVKFTQLCIFYIPHADLNTIVNATSKHNLTTLTMKVQIDLEATPDYYLFWITTGIRPRLTNISIMDKHEVNQSRIAYLWKNVSLLDIPVVDPDVHSAAINPLIRDDAFIPPSIIQVPINGSTLWSDLNTSVKSSLVDQSLEIILEEHNITMTTTNITSMPILGPRVINVTKADNKTFEFQISLYVVNVSDAYIELFFPGAVASSGYLSSVFNPVGGARTHWYLLSRHGEIASSLPREILEWWFSEMVVTTQLYMMRSLVDTNNSVHVIYIPHLSIVGKYVDENTLIEFERSLYDTLIPTVIQFAGTRGVTPLLLFITLGEQEGHVIYAGGELEKTDIAEVDITMTQVVSLLLSYSNALPINHGEIFTLNKLVSDLESEIKELRRNLEEVNITLSDTQSKLSSCESERELLQVKLMDVENLRRRAEELYNTAILYLVSGVVVVVAVSVMLGFLAFRVALRKRS